MRIGSLFSGAGGLDLAVERVFGGRTVWHCEIDPAASKVLAYRWPGVPNLGDITAVDWSAVDPVDVLCGGFPCQDVSAAGRRAGIKAGTRSGLWLEFAEVINQLRPRYVVIENVRGLLSGYAYRAVECANLAVGDGSGRPVLRAAGAVLGDLADLGYDAQWTTVSAASVGAPHKRERVFILATLADARSESRRAPQGQRSGSGEAASRGACGVTGGRSLPPAADTAGLRGTDIERRGVAAGQPVLAEPGAGGGDRGGSTAQGVRELRGSASELATVDLLPTPAASRSGRNRSASAGAAIRPSLDSITDLLPTPRARDGKGRDPNPRGVDLNEAVSLLPTPTASDGQRNQDFARADRTSSGSDDLVTTCVRAAQPGSAGQWGKYEPAIQRWESLTRAAPSPTEPNTKGNPRLAPAFPEWMQGWPDGWATAVPGISRNDQLRIIGNGVCPQQAMAALWQLIPISEVAA